MVARLQKAIEHRLATYPTDYGKPLRGNLKSLWSLRVGDYRVIYQIGGQRVTLLQIVHRRDAYEAGLLEVRARGWL
ncbi:MAG: type II toxin-antitoxin system RelE/ParE family toxin [Elusimicrobia bacterium]|nr:type II toxin-antitoxin system RelE/ParE family toxin [Elusimicrobiota bacterium]